MKNAVIFDMDGVLIDSEPIWKEAEFRVFTSLGVNVTRELTAITASMTTAEVTRFWHEHHPWTGKGLHEVENQVIDMVGQLIMEKGKPITGSRETLDFFRAMGYKIGLSTNSPAKLIPLVLEKMEIAHYFNAVSSSEHEKHGKPHPAVYLTTAAKLGIPPSRCIVFEDSVHGVMAAKNAKMTTIAIPPGEQFHLEGFDLADIKLRSLSDFGKNRLEYLLNSI